jgi:hypothetical protein
MNAGGVPNTCKSNESLWVTEGESGERVSNTWLTCPTAGDNDWKRSLKPHTLAKVRGFVRKSRKVLREGAVAHQLVGRVTAYQGEDG